MWSKAKKVIHFRLKCIEEVTYNNSDKTVINIQRNKTVFWKQKS